MGVMNALAQLCSQASEPRYERKYLLPPRSAEATLALLKQHPARFTEVYQQRWVQSVYFDTPDNQHFYANVAGSSQRLKVRVRWYNQQLADSQLEFKYKDGHIVTKRVEAVQRFDLFSCQIELTPSAQIDQAGSDEEPCSTERAFLQSIIRLHRPVLENRYRRRYLMSADGQFRVTVDTELAFQSRQNSITRWSEFPHQILEIKYPLAADDGVDQITRFLPFRVSRSSKYVYGRELCG